jgi:hypothetical protein
MAEMIRRPTESEDIIAAAVAAGILANRSRNGCSRRDSSDGLASFGCAIWPVRGWHPANGGRTTGEFCWNETALSSAMTWRPTPADLELIATMGHARATTARIAGALGISRDVFTAWAARLAATRELEADVLSYGLPLTESLSRCPKRRKARALPRFPVERAFG